MSSSKPENREEFINWCLRRLGAPVIRINVAREQVEDIVDAALQKFHREHYNGSINLYLPAEVTAQVKQDRFFPLDKSIIAVERVLETNSVTTGQFSAEYGLISSTYPFALKGSGLASYTMAMQYLQTLRDVTSGRFKNHRFNMRMNRMFIDTDWSQVPEGRIFVVEATRALDPDEFTDIWDDQWLKRYATCLIKLQWGNNLRKMQNVQLVGGVQIDGLQIVTEANEELRDLEADILLSEQEPVMPFMA